MLHRLLKRKHSVKNVWKNNNSVLSKENWKEKKNAKETEIGIVTVIGTEKEIIVAVTDPVIDDVHVAVIAVVIKVSVFIFIADH